MMAFIARRLARAFLTLVCVSFLVFCLLDLAPGQYFDTIKLDQNISQETLAALRSSYGLDHSLPVRYVDWLRSIGRGEFGFSFVYNSPVWPLVRVRLRNTLLLAITALLVSWLIAFWIGIWLAAHRNRWQDHLGGLATTFLLALPEVLIGLGLLAFALRTHWFPTGGMTSLTFAEMGAFEKARDAALHLFLPVSALVAGALPVLVRHVRSAVIDVLHAPFIAAARIHGIPRRRLLLRHVLPAALNPLISLFGISAGMLLGGSLLIEVIMSWPGIGPMLLQAILERDSYVVVAIVMLSTLLLVTGNLIADMLLYFADPRIKESRMREK
jgi:peptide/nickel transport system permease protein